MYTYRDGDSKKGKEEYGRHGSHDIPILGDHPETEAEIALHVEADHRNLVDKG